MTMSARALLKELQYHANPQQAQILMRFFKTGVGQYGYGDVFLGLKVPLTRKLSANYTELSLTEIEQLLRSPYHEARLSALIILVYQYQHARTEVEKKAIYQFYLTHTEYINNWDLVDTSAHHIVGAYLHNKSKKQLFQLAKSVSLWERRIAMIATLYDIRMGDPVIALSVAKSLLNDTHDLMYKAVGWMLREVGRCCGREYLINFLNIHATRMPRTALRYAIEHLPAKQRAFYLGKSSVRTRAS